MAVHIPLRRAGAAVVVSTFLSLALAVGIAQDTAPSSEVRVVIVDESGAGVPNSEVAFRSDSQTIVAVASKEGSFTVALPSGRYAIAVSHFGFLKNEVPDFQVVAPEPGELRVVLKLDQAYYPFGPVSVVRALVVDQQGAVIADGEVTFKSDSKTLVSRSERDGSVTVTLPSGKYAVAASHRGFLKKEVPDFQVVAPEPGELRVVLGVDPNASQFCGPCGCSGCRALIPATTSDVPNVISPEPARESPSPPAAEQAETKKMRSWHCLYLWKCSRS